MNNVISMSGKQCSTFFSLIKYCQIVKLLLVQLFPPVPVVMTAWCWCGVVWSYYFSKNDPNLNLTIIEKRFFTKVIVLALFTSLILLQTYQRFLNVINYKLCLFLLHVL